MSVSFLAALCYFLSGALALAYQVLWLRQLVLIFGNTVHAVSTVLAVCFAGLALGSWLIGRWIDHRPAAGLRWYGVLETVVGLWAFASPWLFDTIQSFAIRVYQASGLSTAALVGASFVGSAAILLVPTTLMGATWPALSRFLMHRRGDRGVTIAQLYGLNAAGAMVGVLAVYFVALPALGLFRTLMVAGVANLIMGTACILCDWWVRAPEAHEPSAALSTSLSGAATQSPPAMGRAVGELRWLLAAFALSGASAMMYEVAWTRALSLVVGGSIYAFCIMLATFLGGMALGALAAQRFLRARAATIELVIVGEGLLGACGWLSIWLFSRLPDWFVSLWPLTGRSFIGASWLQGILSAVVMAAPAWIFGALFPLVTELVTRQGEAVGRRVGLAYAINTLGGITGSFVTGFVLMQWIGVSGTIAMAAAMNLIACAMLYARFGRQGAFLSRVAVAAGCVIVMVMMSAVVVVPLWGARALTAGVYLNPDAYAGISVEEGQADTRLLYYRDGLHTTVSVHEDGGERFLKVGGKTDASTGDRDMATQVLLAHVPMLLHRDPRRVLVIGLGSGITLGHAGRYPVTALHCVEVEPAVIEAARYFTAENFAVRDDPRTRIVQADARSLLLASPERYDVIISEPSNPWMAGEAFLFTQEMFELAKRRLTPEGLMCQWLHFYKMFPEDVKLVLKTFHQTFPYVSVWYPAAGDLLVVGSMEPQRVDREWFAGRMTSPRIQQSLALVGFDTPEALLNAFWFGEEELEELTADVPWLHRDDRPLLEFTAPKAYYFEETFLMNYAELERYRRDPRAAWRAQIAQQP